MLSAAFDAEGNTLSLSEIDNYKWNLEIDFDVI